MFVIQVTPLIKATQLESLSYFSSYSYEIGSFLHVPIRGKLQPAIVTSVSPASTTKTALKAATFSLRKLPLQENVICLPESIRHTASLLTEKYPVSLGAMLFTLLPPDVRNGLRPHPFSGSLTKQAEETAPQLLTARTDDRYLSYQSHIRSTFARRGSVLFVVPTAIDIAYAKKQLGHGIEERLVILSSTQTKKQRDEAFHKLGDTSIAKLIITTPSYAYLERVDLTSIIIEQSASTNYVNRERPYLDHRDALITYANLTGRSLILGDTVPRTEDEVYRREERFLTFGEEVKRIVFTAPLNIISQKDKPHPDMPFQLFSPELKRTVERTLEGRGKVFFYAARRGLSPVIACIDCGYIFRCPDSHTPYSLVRTQKDGVEERWFVSSTSGARVRAADVCTHCGSWRLRERGIGIQHIYDEWKAQMPDAPITILDHTIAPTAKQAEKIANVFFAERSGILLGTQIALPYLTHGVDVSAVISLDAARAIPTWRADESLFRLLLRLRECTEKEVILQTRTTTDTLLTHASRGAIERFYDDEIALRSMVKYPPYATFILLTWVGSQEAVTTTDAIVKNLFGAIPVQFYSAPYSTKESTQRHALIKIGSTDKALYKTAIAAARTLPPYIKVEINPERIV